MYGKNVDANSIHDFKLKKSSKEHISKNILLISTFGEKIKTKRLKEGTIITLGYSPRGKSIVLSVFDCFYIEAADFGMINVENASGQQLYERAKSLRTDAGLPLSQRRGPTACVRIN